MMKLHNFLVRQYQHEDVLYHQMIKINKNYMNDLYTCLYKEAQNIQLIVSLINK